MVGGWKSALLLAVLSPLCAEYLYGYDTSTGRPSVLVLSLLIFGPLYGCAALLVREAVARAGWNWTRVVLLGAAFGVVQAGLVDQSVFDSSYRDIRVLGRALRPPPTGRSPASA